MKEALRDRVFKYFAVSLVLLIIAIGLVMAWPDYQRRKELIRQESELMAQIEEKKQEIAELKEKQRRFQTDVEFIESIARQNGRVYPGELVFLYDND